MTYWAKYNSRRSYEDVDTPSRHIASQLRSGVHFARFTGLLVFLCVTFPLAHFAHSQTSIPNSSPEAGQGVDAKAAEGARPHWDYAKLEAIIKAGDTISDCSVSGSDLADLLIRTEAVNDSAYRLSAGIQIQNADIEGAVTVIGGNVPLPVVFTNCNFRGAVNFDDTTFAHSLEILRSHFDGEVTATRMHISGNFVVKGSIFTSPGPVSFTNAQIDGDLIWRHTRFLGAKGVDCTRLTVSQDVDLSNLEFAGFANFQHCLINRLLTIENCQFKGADQAADFSSATTKEDLLVRSSKFFGSALWDHINARGLYFSDQTSFSQPLEFRTLTIDRSMSLDTVETVSDITVADSKIFEDLRVNDLKIKASPGKDNRSIRPGFHLLGTDIKNLKLAAISIAGTFDLEDDNIGTLDVGDYVPRNGSQNQCKLANLNVDSFQTQNSTARSLLDFVNSSEFDPEIYLCLEKFFNSRGETELADETFIDRNKRFEDVRPKDLGWLGQTITGILAGYGRDPKRSLFPCLIVVVLGWFVFADKTKMRVTEDKFQDRHYNFWYAFWYSLDVFAPIIDLEAAKVWSPVPGQTFRWFFFRLERILGWLLVPIAIAAFTGFLHS